jgi:hypothetical protein
MALKSFIAASLVAATMALLPGTAPAEAKTKIVIGIGTAGWDHSCWNGYRYYCGGWPRPRYYYRPPIHAPYIYESYHYDNYYDNDYSYRRPIRARMSCGAARNLVDRSGYSRVNASECRGDVYTFTARRNGKSYLVKVDAFARRIIGTRRI